MINTCDLKKHNENLREEILRVINGVIDRNSLVLGGILDSFEMNFAKYCGVKHVIGVGNGTDALALTLRALNIKEGSEVIASANSYNATIEAIAQNRAKITLVDANRFNYNLDHRRLKEAITKRTELILPTHLYGNPADIEHILEVAGDIPVVFDGCQAHGARYKGRSIAKYGKATCFSFYPTKNLGCLGDGGAIATDDDELARKLRILRNHGQSSKDNHTIPGFNSRLDDLQAGILEMKLKHLDAWNAKRRELAGVYDSMLSPFSELTIPFVSPDSEPVYHIYPLVARNREKLLIGLKDKGINCAVHYPIPIHMQPAFRSLGYKYTDFPTAERLAEREISLPIYPELERDDVRKIAQAVKEVCLR